MAESDLVERLRAGDEEAFRRFVREHHASMIRFARTFVSTAQSAEEVVQETWLAVFQGLDRFEGRSSVKTWVYGILANRARTRGVRDGRTALFSELAAEGAEPEPAVDPSRFGPGGSWREPPTAWGDPERLLLSAELRRQMAQALETLPAGQRAVFVLRDVEGLSSEEACNVLGVSETNQRVLLHRARSRLRSALETKIGPSRRES